MEELCPNKDVCGSCSWSEMPYAEQLSTKIQQVNAGFKTAELDHQIEEILPSPQTEHYRNRMDFVIDFEGRVGLRQKGKWWRVIDNHTCFISDKRIESAFSSVRTWVKEANLSFFDRKRHSGLLRYALIRASTIGEVLVDILTSVPTAEETPLIRSALETLSSTEHISTLLWSTNPTVADVSFGNTQLVCKGSGTLAEEISGVKYRISPHSFFQTNSHSAGLLLEQLRQWVRASGTKRLLDLYCGTGFFAVGLASECERVFGVELFEAAVEDARFNAVANQREIEFAVAASENFDWGTFEADTVVVDPPRGGLHPRVLKTILEKQPQRIFYVSCNYLSYLKELPQLQALYEVRSQLLVDQFPHTPHVELLAWLERRA